MSGRAGGLSGAGGRAGCSGLFGASGQAESRLASCSQVPTAPPPLARPRRFMKYFGPTALLGLLYTIIIMFMSQGDKIINEIGYVARTAVPMFIYFMIMFFGSFGMSWAVDMNYSYAVTQVRVWGVGVGGCTIGCLAWLQLSWCWKQPRPSRHGRCTWQDTSVIPPPPPLSPFPSPGLHRGLQQL